MPRISPSLSSDSKRPDAYIIHDSGPSNGGLEAQYAPGDIIPFTLQKLSFNEQYHCFDLTMTQPIATRLKIHHYYHRNDENYDLPYQLDGVFTDYDMIPASERSDPVFGALDSGFRFTFRFDPRQRMGCLVHFGTDVAAYERAPMSLLWRTAINRSQTTDPSKILELTSDISPKIFPVIPSDR